ncbi:MAG TPA: dTDP-4-dehydrorhamnose 3,5-epimerase [Thermoanaerobaculia bacterium]
MIFTETAIPGAFVIDVERVEDERGFFARTWSEDELRDHGLDPTVVQCNLSYNARQATLRGLHYQRTPHEETKIVRCTAGAIHDVVVDLRRSSPAYRKWTAVELTAENRRMLYIPHGVAHGFITLTDASEVHYQMGARYVAEAAAGVRWDDPAFGIEWPLEPLVISERDRSFPLWKES